MIRVFSCLLALCSSPVVLGAADTAVLFRWPAGEGSGGIVRDSSGNGLDGRSTAALTDVNGIKALTFDGSPKSVVRLKVPGDKLLGTGNWSLSLWLRPEVLGCAGAEQNQRRFFNYGKYPDAAICLGLNADGCMNWYFCYQDPNGKTVATGGASAARFKTSRWTHLVFVTDVANQRITVYLNGCPGGSGAFPPGWNGDFRIGDELTIGSGWQNHQGAVADVALWRRALTPTEATAEFNARNAAYGVAFGEGRTTDEVLADLIEKANRSMAENKTVAAREIFTRIRQTDGVQPSMAAWSELREAQTFNMDGDTAAAKAVYVRIRDNPSYLAHHRQEAKEILTEIERTAKGLPATDPSDSRVGLATIREFAAEIHLSPDGNDANPGTEKLPVATLQKARDLARAARASATGPVAVTLQNGVYPMQDSLALDAGDSGTAGAPVVWRAATPGGAVLYGGTRLNDFHPVTDPAILSRLPEDARSKVVQCDLKAAGITDYGQLAVRGFGQPPSPPTLEVYVNRQPMTLARWPNKGFVPAGKLLQPGDKKSGKPSVFTYTDDRHARWLKAEDPWIFGYFHWLWADATAKIGAIDPQAKTLTTAQAYHYGNEGMNEVQGIIYHAFNLLEEIDQPGEWYLNRSTGILYLYPPGDPENSRAVVEISMLSKPMISAAKLTHTRFEGLTLDLSRADCAILRDSSDCVFAGCTVSRIAGNGVSILGGARNLLLSCNIHTIGRRATEVIGGDRPTLTPGNHVVANCEIHHFGRIDRTYTPGIQLEGVGNRVAHNFFHDCPSSVMRIEGNDHVIEFNEVRDAVLESDDQGSMELFGNPTYRGVVFRHNLFIDIGLREPKAMVHGQAAIRFDDIISEMLVYGNVFVRAAKGRFGALQMNGGRDNILENNLFVDCPQGVTGGYRANHRHWQHVRDGSNKGCITNDLYQKRYPLVSTMLDGKGVNHGTRNIFRNCGPDFVSKSAMNLYSNINVGGEPVAAGLSKTGRSRLTPDASAVAATGFRPVPLDRIGIYQDSWRPR